MTSGFPGVVRHGTGGAAGGLVRWRPLGFLLVSALIHAGFWLWFARTPDRPAKPLPQTMEVTLSAPAASAPAPPNPASPPATPPEQPKVQPKPVSRPVPKPVPKPVRPMPARAAEPAPEPERPVPTPAAPAAPAASSAAATAPASPQHSAAPASNSAAYEPARANAAYLHNPRPEYPAQARRREWEGKVLLKVQVMADGTAGQVSVQASSSHDLLDEAAVEAVRRWHFVPAKRGGQPVESWVTVPISFNLKSE